jgi:hypothetical protein
MLALCFALRCFSSQQAKTELTGEQLRAGLRREEKLFARSNGTTEVVP